MHPDLETPPAEIRLRAAEATAVARPRTATRAHVRIAAVTEIRTDVGTVAQRLTPQGSLASPDYARDWTEAGHVWAPRRIEAPRAGG